MEISKNEQKVLTVIVTEYIGHVIQQAFGKLRDKGLVAQTSNKTWQPIEPINQK